MKQFIQIENHAYNLNHIERVHFTSIGEQPVVHLYFVDTTKDSISLAGEQAQAFIYWWNENAIAFRMQ